MAIEATISVSLWAHAAWKRLLISYWWQQVCFDCHLFVWWRDSTKRCQSIFMDFGNRYITEGSC